MKKMNVTLMALLILGLFTSVHASAFNDKDKTTTLSFPLYCAYYRKDDAKEMPDVLTVVFERTQEGHFKATSYSYKVKRKEYSDLVITGHFDDGRLNIHAPNEIGVELRIDEKSGFGIFYDVFGNDVKCGNEQPVK